MCSTCYGKVWASENPDRARSERWRLHPEPTSRVGWRPAVAVPQRAHVKPETLPPTKDDRALLARIYVDSEPTRQARMVGTQRATTPAYCVHCSHTKVSHTKVVSRRSFCNWDACSCRLFQTAADKAADDERRAFLRSMSAP